MQNIELNEGQEFFIGGQRYVVKGGVPIASSKRKDGMTPTIEVLNQFFGQNLSKSKNTDDSDFDRTKVWRDGW